MQAEVKSGIETEYRFRIHPEVSSGLCVGSVPFSLAQFYLSVDPARTVRVREVPGLLPVMTCKGKRVGASCPEEEFPVPAVSVPGLRRMAIGRVVEKLRHPWRDGEGRLWEIDLFLGPLHGLVIAEIEIADRPVPPFPFVAEVTEDPRYSNARLAVASDAEIAALLAEGG